jgi:DNA-binding NarL/FixJ family response regulator
VVVILSAYDDPHYVRAAMAAGVTGYLLKTLPSHELVDALRDACTGTGRLGGLPIGRGERDTADPAASPYEELTAREAGVVHLVARGMSNKAIAHDLGISPRTVEGHLNHVFDKLGIGSRTELVHYALANSLFSREPAGDPRPPEPIPEPPGALE